MFYKYEIKNNGIEDILYLYLTMSYEFSKELGLNSDDQELTRRTKNFIKNNGIQFQGNKVYLVIDGIVVKTLDVQEEKQEVEVLRENLYYSNDYYFVTVELENNALVEISLKDYLLGSLATMMIPELELETLKALAILFRTYAFKEMNENKKIPAINDYVIYKPISYYKLSWIQNYDDIVQKLQTAIVDTDCLFLTYNHYYILPFIHFSNHGKTLTSDSYPYLSSVASLWDLASPYYIGIQDYSYLDFSKIMKTTVTSNTNIEILDVDDHHLVKKIQIGNVVFTGDELRNLLNLRSKNISIIVNKNFIRFIIKGWGNFLGLSIFGANELAKNDCAYANILKYYFPKVTLNKYIKELP